MLFLLLSEWNLGGKEESLPIQLSILHIPNPNEGAPPQSDMSMPLTLQV